MSRELTEYAASISTAVPAGIVSSRARNFVEVELSACDSWTEFTAAVGNPEDCDTAVEQTDITPNIKASDRLMRLEPSITSRRAIAMPTERLKKAAGYELRRLLKICLEIDRATRSDGNRSLPSLKTRFFKNYAMVTG